MELAYQELAQLKSRLPETEVIGNDFILDYNEIIRNAAQRTEKNLLHLLITTADVIPSSGEFQGMRTGEPRFPIRRARLLGRLDEAIQYFEKQNS
jgi:hypothetical protein